MPLLTFIEFKPLALRVRWQMLASACVVWLRQAREDLLHAPLEPILHPSCQRLRWIGLFTLVWHLSLGWVWDVWLPQPWESYSLRLTVAALGLPLLLGWGMRDLTATRTRVLFSLVCWFSMPVFFIWMYLCNGGNTVWLASLAAILVIYYHVTDWRLATLGTACGGVLAWGLSLALGSIGPLMTAENILVNGVVIAFAWLTALSLGISGANLRREHLSHTLATMGILAHEFRTPLATMSLLGEALNTEALSDAPSPERIKALVGRLRALVLTMNYQIDTQIVNARLLHLASQTDEVCASQLVRERIENFPYRNRREHECVRLYVSRDFQFRGSQALFAQVVDNLLKNALRALAAVDRQMQPGDLSFEIDATQKKGRIVVTDSGIGMTPVLMRRIFEPFFSTHHGSGHGLGLAFCRRVVHAAHGVIRVRSEPGQGAEFTIELPLLKK